MTTPSYATDADLLARVPAASAIDAAIRAVALEDAQPMISLSVYGAHATRAHTYYAAHLLSVMYPSTFGGGEGGPITGKSAGEISVSMADVSVAPTTEAAPSSTYWGRRFLEIQRIVSASVRVVG
jgi:hypothetical protein